MSAINPAPIDRLILLRIGNRDADFAIDGATGFIRSAVWKRTNIDLFTQIHKGASPQTIGGLRIYDELDERWYSDLETPATVSGMRLDGQTVSFSRRYAGAPFIVDVVLRCDDDALHWEVRAAKTGPAVPDRSLRVYFFLPLVAGWDIWAPAWQGEFTFDGMSSFEYMHVQVPYVSNHEVVLPMISHYSRRLDVGYTMMEPIDAQVPAAKFQFSNGEKCFNWGSMRKDVRSVPVLEAVNYYIGLVAERPLATKVMLMLHEGDWRPAVGRVFARWREFFVPSSPAIYEWEGVWDGGDVTKIDRAQRFRDFQVKSYEVHWHFENYGDYLQEGRTSWPIIVAKEEYFLRHRHEGADERQVEAYFASHSDTQVAAHILPPKYGDFAATGGTIRRHRSEISERLPRFRENGCGAFWYFNYTDGFRLLAESRWPDSIARNEDGSYQASGWHMSHNMNADPRWSFGKHMIESARKIIAEYPMIQGFFMDCFRHFEIDFAHDDGITVVNHQPAYSMNFSYDAAEAVIKPMLNECGMSTYANKPQTIRSLRWVDGVLLEGNGDIAEEKFFWGAIAKPMYFVWTRSDKTTDENLRRAIYHGAFPRLPMDLDQRYDENLALYRRYVPLCEQLRRRVLCFEPDPLRVPKGSRGRLYTVGSDYVAAIMSELLEAEDTVTFGRTPHAVLRVARGSDVGRVGVMLPGDSAFCMVDVHFNGTFIFVPLAGYKNCAVVKLFVTGTGGAPLGTGRFQESVDYCGDPESAFCERNDR